MNTFTEVNEVIMRTMKLTANQKKVLDFVYNYIRFNKYSPTLQEIADEHKISRQGARDYVDILVKKGYLVKDKVGKQRNLEVVQGVDAYTTQLVREIESVHSLFNRGIITFETFEELKRKMINEYLGNKKEE